MHTARASAARLRAEAASGLPREVRPPARGARATQPRRGRTVQRLSLAGTRRPHARGPRGSVNDNQPAHHSFCAWRTTSHSTPAGASGGPLWSRERGHLGLEQTAPLRVAVRRSGRVRAGAWPARRRVLNLWSGFFAVRSSAAAHSMACWPLANWRCACRTARPRRSPDRAGCGEM